MSKKISESSENDPEQLAHTSENSPVLSLSETDSGPVESESSQTGATKSDLEPSVSATDTQQNFEPPYKHCQINRNGRHSKTKTFVFKVERLSYIQISKQVHKLEIKYSFLILCYIIIYDNDTCIT